MPDPAAVMDADPRRAGGGVHQRVEQRPVGDRIGAVAHRLRLAVRATRRTPQSRWSRPMTIGAPHLAPRDEVVEGSPGPRPLAVAQPADAGRQPLERDLGLGHADPASERRRSRGTAPGWPRRCAWMSSGSPRQRDPAERTLALAEQRPDERGHEARVVECVGRRPPPGPGRAGCCRSRRRRRRPAGRPASRGRGRPSSASRAAT